MTDHIPNTADSDALVVFEHKKLKMVFPDEIVAAPGQWLEWEITVGEAATVFFDSDSPFDWKKRDSTNGRIKGTIERDAVGIYKYSVTDAAGNITIDPRIRIKR